METPQNYVTVSRRPLDVEDYIDILRRYRSWVIGPTFAGLVIAVVIAFFWPDTYESRAILRIMPQSIPQSMVPDAVAGAMNERLQQMEVDILGRPNLSALIQRPSLDLYKKERARRPLDDVAEDMRIKDVHVIPYNPQGASQTRGAQAFIITFHYPDRFKAQLLVRELATEFQAKNITLEQNEAESTTNFIQDELKAAKARMDTSQAKLSQFTTENQGRLPENYQANIIALNDKDRAIQSAEDQIGRDQMARTNLESELASNHIQQEATKGRVERIEPVAGGATTVRNDNLIKLNDAIRVEEQALEGYLHTYKDTMPEATTAKAKIARLKEERDKLQREADANAAVAAGPTSTLVKNPQAEQELLTLQANERRIQSAIVNAQTEIDNLNRRIAMLAKDKQDIQARIASSPQVVQQYNNLVQEVALAKESYDQESRRRDQSQTVKNLEDHKAGEYLDLLESATLPEIPFAPNRYAITGLGTLFGLLAGFAMAGAKELKNTTLKNLKDVRAYTNLAILSSIPLLENALLVRRKRRLAWLAWSSAVIVGGILMCGAAYYHFSGGAGPS